MSQFNVNIEAMPSPNGGPYVYSIDKDQVGLKAATGLQTISAAMDAVKTDIGANLGGQTVKRVFMQVDSG